MSQTLAVNAGSSSLKLSVIDGADTTVSTTELGRPGTAETTAGLLAFIEIQPRLGAVGHRIVHGGRIVEPVVVDGAIRQALDEGASIAPLHVPPALSILDLLRDRLPDVPHVACFDTTFHAAMPAAAATYAIPAEWRTVIRRFGFHGLSCAWSLRQAAASLDRPSESVQIIVAHLGSGASVTAVRDGHGVDTTMGFTPLEGLVMSTRSGSVDPGALLWLQREWGVAADRLSDALEHESGLVALAGTGDMREVLHRADTGDLDAITGRDVFVHRVRSAIAAMAASLDRIDAVVFTGGIGENAGDVRQRVCAGLQVLGLSANGSGVPVLVFHAREDMQMVHEVHRVLSASAATH